MSRGNRVAPCGQTDRQMDGRTDGPIDKKKLIVALRIFANAPNNLHI